MATEPVNERPIFPALLQVSALGIGQWSTSMIRQLTTVFQQYGYRLNKALLDEDLDTNGGDIVTDGGDSVLRESNLEQNSGTIPEIGQAATWTGVQTFTPAQIFSAAPVATGNPLRFDELAENGGSIPELDRVNNFVSMLQVGGDGLVVLDSNANGSWISFAGLFAVAWRVVTPDWTTVSFQDWAMPITFGMAPMMFVTMATHGGGGPGNAALAVLQGCTTSASGGNGTFRIAFRDGTDANAAGEQITLTAMGTI